MLTGREHGVAAFPDAGMGGEGLGPILDVEPVEDGLGRGQDLRGADEGTLVEHVAPETVGAAGGAEEPHGLRREQAVEVGQPQAAEGRPVRRAEHPEPGDAAVRVHVEAHAGRRDRGGRFQQMLAVGCDPTAGHDLDPAMLVVGRGGVDRDGAGGVPLEVRGVDQQRSRCARQAQPDHQPVVAVAPPASRLPAVVHPRGRPRLEHVLGRREEVVADRLDAAAELEAGQVGQGVVGIDLAQGREGDAHDSQPGHATVGNDPQPEVGAATGRVELDVVLVVGLNRVIVDQWLPLGAGPEEVTDRQRGAGAVETEGLRRVAAEVSGVDHDPADEAGDAEPDDAPVVAGPVLPAGLPPVHPLSPVGVEPFTELGRGRRDETGRRGEELVAGKRTSPPTAADARSINGVVTAPTSRAAGRWVGRRPRRLGRRPRPAGWS